MTDVFKTRRENLRRLAQERVGWPTWVWLLVVLGIAQVVLQVI